MSLKSLLTSRTSLPTLGGALAVAVLLLASALFIWQEVRSASLLVARGVGSELSARARDAFRETGWPPPQQAVSAFYEAHADEGLRAIAIVDASGQTLASAGGAIAGPLREGTLQFDGDVARLVHRGGRPTPGAAGTPGEVPPMPPSRAAPAGSSARSPPAFLVAYEFEPRPALELLRQAGQLLAVAGLSALGIVALAIALSRVTGQRERMQAELERGRRLAALGEMSAVLAHELRNPLASLKGHAQLLEELVEDDPKLHAKAERLVTESVRLERLMTDLLAFVRSGELVRAPTRPDDVLRAAVEATGPERIDVTYLSQPFEWQADAGRLQQALENVLRNGLQASPPDQRVDVAVERAGEGLCFRVRDRGPGVPAGEEERIFEPFVTGKLRGVGLGLSVTRRIVELHGGSITVTNHPSGGAEFRMVLPPGKG